MSPKAVSPVTSLPTASIRLAQPEDSDYGTARLRLPLAVWTAAGIGYHRPVVCTVRTGEETWRIYCISALVAEDSIDRAVPLLDARVVLTPAGCETLTGLSSLWQQPELSVSVQAVSGPVQNAKLVQVRVPGAEQVPASVLRIKLAQALLVQGSHITLAPGVSARVSICDPAPATSATHQALFRITPSTQLLTESDTAPHNAPEPSTPLNSTLPATPTSTARLSSARGKDAPARSPQSTGSKVSKTPKDTTRRDPDSQGATSSRQPPGRQAGASAAPSGTPRSHKDTDSQSQAGSSTGSESQRQKKTSRPVQAKAFPKEPASKPKLSNFDLLEGLEDE